MNSKWVGIITVSILVPSTLRAQDAKQKESPVPTATHSLEEAEAYYNSGMDKYGKSDVDGEIADFTRAIELNPKYERAYNMRGLARTQKGDLNGAIADYSRAIELNPQNVALYNNRGKAEETKGDYDGAIADFTRVIELNPQAADYGNLTLGYAYNERGEVHAKKKQYNAATKDMQKATELDPKNGYCWSILAWYQLFDRHPREAIAASLKALKLSPDDARAININLAHGYLFNNQFVKAKSIYLENEKAKLGDDKRTFSQAVLDDFKELQDAGITHPDVEKIKTLMMITVRKDAAAEATATDNQVKRLAQRYNEIEAQLNRSVHYLKKTDAGGGTTTEQAWVNGAGDLIKVSAEHSDASGRELTEYIALDFDNDYDGMFVLTRKETPSPDGGTQVDESRKYFGEDKGGNGQLIRELRKSTHFKAGESTDTVHVPNVVVDLTRESDQMSEDELREIMLAPEKIANKLREAGSPVADPFANVKGDSGEFRVIHGTASPDGRYAIALGLARKEINWDDFVDKDYPEKGPTYYAENEDDVRNYAVELASQRILGETGCNYFGTRRRYNHRACTVTWSPDSMKFVQLWDDKWSSTACVAGKINLGPKFAGAVDLDKAIEKKTYAFVRERLDPEDGGSLSLGVDKVGDDGVIDLDASALISGGEHKGETKFAVNERLCLRETPKGLQVDILKMRRLAKESPNE